jgi:hypothetical protein
LYSVLESITTFSVILRRQRRHVSLHKNDRCDPPHTWRLANRQRIRRAIGACMTRTESFAGASEQRSAPYKEIPMSRNSAKDAKRTKSGKPRNALIHGVYARDVILPFESREDLEVLHAELRLELRPVGRLEDEFVWDITYLRWQKRRMVKMWAAAAYNDPYVGDFIRTGKKSYSGIRKGLRLKAKSFCDVTEEVDRFCVELIATAKKTAGALLSGNFEKSDVSDAEKRLQGIKSLIEGSILPLMLTLEQGPSAEKTLRRTYSPEYLERIHKLEQQFDSREASLLSKLVRLQEYKRIRESYPAPGALPEGNQSRALLSLR